MPRRGSFLTVFETGGVVFTKNYCGGVEVQEADFLATGGRTESARHLPPQPPTPAGSSWKPIVFCLAAGLLMVTLVGGADTWLSSDQRVILLVLSGLAVICTLLPIRPQGATPRCPVREPVDLDLRVPLVETLARHRLNVNRLIAQGQQLPAVFDGDEFIATQQRYYRHPRLRRLRQSSMGTLLLGKLIVLAPLPTIFFCTLGVREPLPWSILLVEGLVGLYLRYGCSSATVLNILRGFSKNQ
jgi:hypothetical protein